MATGQQFQDFRIWSLSEIFDVKLQGFITNHIRVV